MKNFASCARLAALPLALAAAFPSLAQTQLQEVVVTASRSQQLLIEALPHTTVIGRDVIERSQAVDLPSLLSSEAGFQFTQNGGRGTSANLLFAR
jgi:vitamin B12 transporter